MSAMVHRNSIWEHYAESSPIATLKGLIYYDNDMAQETKQVCLLRQCAKIHFKFSSRWSDGKREQYGKTNTNGRK